MDDLDGSTSFNRMEKAVKNEYEMQQELCEEFLKQIEELYQMLAGKERDERSTCQQCQHHRVHGDVRGMAFLAAVESESWIVAQEADDEDISDFF